MVWGLGSLGRDLSNPHSVFVIKAKTKLPLISVSTFVETGNVCVNRRGYASVVSAQRGREMSLLGP